MKIRISIILAYGVIFTGMVLVGKSIVSNITYRHQQSQLVEYIEQNEEYQIEQKNTTSESLDNEIDAMDSNNSISKEDKKNNIEELNYINEKIKPIAILEIEKIRLKAGIIEGATAKELKKGIGFYQNTALPDEEEGNFVLAGHDSGKMPVFSRLNKVDMGDIVKIKYKDKYYEYTVVDKFIVDPSVIEILESTPGKKEITMFTCTNKGKQRLVVRGEIKK